MRSRTGSKEAYLLSRIPIRSRSLASMSSIRARLACMPGFRLLNYGSSLRYKIEDEMEDRFYIIEFSKELILLEVYSTTSPLYFMQEALLRILTVASILHGCYELELVGLFPYLISVLARQQLDHYKELSDNEDTPNSGSDIILAKRINSLRNENAELTRAITKSGSKVVRLLSTILVLRHSSSIDVEKVAVENGVEREEVLDSLRHASGLGYRVISLEKGTFGLVRI